MPISIPTKEQFQNVLDEVSQELYSSEAINEVKTHDKAHGRKLPHSVLDDFFRNKAPQMDTLADVEMALHALYTKNGVEFTRQGVKQVISNYKKRIDLSKQQKNKEKQVSPTESVQINEIKTTLSAKETRKKEKIVRALKKKFKEMKQRYGDDAEAVLYATAAKLAKMD